MNHSDPLAGQIVTRQTYEDDQFVQAFLARNGSTGKEVSRHIFTFTSRLNGKRIIDIGCGPGIHAQQFANLDFSVTAVDYSESMIRAAQEATHSSNPSYRHLDMRQVGDAFDANTFDGAWVSASLIHVLASDVPRVLNGIHHILVPDGLARITLKAGEQGQAMVTDDKYGIVIEREFVFWEEDNFSHLLCNAGFDILSVERAQYGGTSMAPTTWLRFVAQAIKQRTAE